MTAMSDRASVRRGLAVVAPALLLVLLAAGSAAGAARESVNRPASPGERYDQLFSCLGKAGFVARRKTGAWPRTLLGLSAKGGVVNAIVFETEAAARKAAADFQKEEAEYLATGRKYGIKAPSSPTLEIDRVFARYAARTAKEEAEIVRCLEGSTAKRSG